MVPGGCDLFGLKIQCDMFLLLMLFQKSEETEILQECCMQTAQSLHTYTHKVDSMLFTKEHALLLR